jgi:histidyl-tRNA synthetase
LNEDCHNHLKAVLEYLDELEIPYELNPHLVRGLDYYTKTVFEIWPKNVSAQGALGGGGRYDTLINDLGGQGTPAVGFAGGIERLIMAIQEQGLDIQRVKKADVFLGQLGELAKKKSLKVFEELRDAGVDIVEALGKNSIKSQLKVADKLGVKITLILGQKEAIDGTIIVRDMESGIQEIVDITKIVKEVQKRLEKQVRFTSNE